MKPLSRRSVTTGLVAVVTAVPSVALAIAARGDPLERIKQLTCELEEAMREAYGVEVQTLAYPKTDEGKPMVLVVAHTR
jgi:hypothetical protein